MRSYRLKSFIKELLVYSALTLFLYILFISVNNYSVITKKIISFDNNRIGVHLRVSDNYGAAGHLTFDEFLLEENSLNHLKIFYNELNNVFTYYEFKLVEDLIYPMLYKKVKIFLRIVIFMLTKR